MQRDILQSVTVLPILVPCKEGEAGDGNANFDRDHILQKIRPVTDEELAATSKNLRPHEQQFLRDCLALRRAYEKKDQLALAGPFERLWPYLIGKELRPQIPPRAPLAVREKLLLDTTWMAKASFSSPRGSERAVEVYYPQLVTQEIEPARLVLWWASRWQRFTPAIFCALPCKERKRHARLRPDLKTALFLMGLLGHIRICPLPTCEKLFVPRQANIEYCSLAHQSTHRMQRFRADKEEKLRKAVDLRAQGQSERQIAETIGKARDSVRRWLVDFDSSQKKRHTQKPSEQQTRQGKTKGTGR
jgi:hypothetical protein